MVGTGTISSFPRLGTQNVEEETGAIIRSFGGAGNRFSCIVYTVRGKLGLAGEPAYLVG